jgi:aminotransferase
MRIGPRLANLAISDIRAMTRACDAVQGINLGQGVCDLPTPAPVADAAVRAIRDNKVIYAPPEGVPALREAIAEKVRVEHGVAVDAAREVLVTSGATGAFAASMLALFAQGDEVILFEPYYGYHLNTVLAMGLSPVLVPLAPPRWDVDFDRLAAAITPRTRGVVLCTPSNPCGKVWSAAELDRLAALCEAHDLVAVTDEIYEHIVYDGVPHVPLATRGAMRARTVSIAGCSKTFAVTGWRVGWLTAPAEALPRLAVAHDLLYVCAPTPLQHACAAGLAMPRAYFDGLSASYQVKRDILCDALDDVGLTPYRPAGAYYVLADARPLGGATARESAMTLLARTGIAAVSGASFYRDPVGETLLRFCFAKEDDVLRDAAARLRERALG